MNFIIIILSLGIIPGFVQAPDDTLLQKTIKTKALYGFSKSHPLLKGKQDSEIIIWLKDMGINAVFFRHKDRVFIERLHKAGIKVHVEYSVFVGEELWQKYPSSRPVTAKGEKLKKYKWYAGVNPTVEEIRQQKLEGIRSLVKETNIDGIWLDFIRWPCHWEVPAPEILQTSFDELTIKKFATDNGLTALLKLEKTTFQADKILTEHLDRWTRWKCQQITSFVAEARKIVDSAKKKILLGSFTVPWTDNDYSGAIKKIIGQDYDTLGRHLDVVSPMLYHKMCNKSVGWIGEVTTKIAGKVNCDIWPVIQLADEPVKIPPHELEKTLQTALTAKGSTGIILFSMKALDRDKIKVVKETLSHF
jgi:uncharacterized lipoprotein YddW (UPF0748 family)